MKSLLLAILVIQLALTSPPEIKSTWFDKPFDKWPIVTLTHKATFKDKEQESIYGASAFLLSYKGRVIACSVQHLLSPYTRLHRNLNEIIESWELHPRTRSDIGVAVERCINKNYLNRSLRFTGDELMILELKNQKIPSELGVLKIGSFPKTGDQLYVIGCEYKDYECVQKKYPVKVINTEFGTRINTTVPPNFAISGFSGAPVLNKYGNVVGYIVMGGISLQIYTIAEITKTID